MGTHAGRSRCGFTAGVTASDNDDIETFAHAVGITFLVTESKCWTIPIRMTEDALMRARRNGLQIAAQDLQLGGGAIGPALVASKLKTSVEEVYGMVQSRRLFAVTIEGELALPAVQFTQGANFEPLPGLEDVLAVFPSDNGWMMLNFMVRPHSGLGGETPVSRLRRGQPRYVIRAARTMGEHGAV